MGNFKWEMKPSFVQALGLKLCSLPSALSADSRGPFTSAQPPGQNAMRPDAKITTGGRKEKKKLLGEF